MNNEANIESIVDSMKDALKEAKKQEELEKQRIADEVEKALKVRMIEVEREERANL